MAIRSVEFEPEGSAKRTVAGEIWDRRQVTASYVGSLLHPEGVVFDLLAYVRPMAGEVSGEVIARTSGSIQLNKLYSSDAEGNGESFVAHGILRNSKPGS
jgi:hypothetical protein